MNYADTKSFGIVKVLSKDIDAYNIDLPHLRVARRLGISRRAKAVEYFMSSGEPFGMSELTDKVIDIDWYVKHQLKPMMTRLFFDDPILLSYLEKPKEVTAHVLCHTCSSVIKPSSGHCACSKPDTKLNIMKFIRNNMTYFSSGIQNLSFSGQEKMKQLKHLQLELAKALPLAAELNVCENYLMSCPSYEYPSVKVLGDH